jgi:peptidoglycan/LPS O-acetylase OafA/YrhL
MVAGGVTGRDAVLFMPMFGLGVLLAFAEDDLARLGDRVAEARAAALRWTALAVACAALLEGSWAVSVATDGRTSGRLTALAHVCEVLGAVLAVALARTWPAARRMLTSTPVAWLGSRSFSVYLVHEPVVVSLALLLGGPPPLAVMVGAGVPAALLVAEGFFRLVEAPALRLAHALGLWAQEVSDRRAATRAVRS